MIKPFRAGGLNFFVPGKNIHRPVEKSTFIFRKNHDLILFSFFLQ